MKNKVVVIVGGSKGIGEGLYNAFIDRDCIVHSISRKNCDITNPDQIDSYFDKLGKVDILINNAAINYCKPIEEISLNEWNGVIDTNLTSYFYIIKKCLPKMDRGSKIVNVSSIAGRSKSLVSGVH